MRIVILSSESLENACARIRLADIVKHLTPAISFSWSGIHRWQSSPGEVQKDIMEADAIVIQRSFPCFETMELINWILFQSKKPVVFEIDDLLTEIPEQNPHYNKYQPCRHLITSFIANCDALITSTSELKDYYSPLIGQSYVFPNTLNDLSWHSPLVSHRVNRPITIGFSGSRSHASDLVCIEEALERIQKIYGDRVNFLFFGCITDRLAQLPNLSYRSEFVPYAEYPDLLRSLRLDIGLAPLEDNLFNACKSNIKYLEYAACGIPSIYSDLPPYRDTVIQGVTGLLVENNHKSWFDAIVTLIEDTESAKNISTAAYNDVWNRFSMQKQAQNWLELIETIITTAQYQIKPENSIARAMWNQATEYEKRLFESKTQLNRVTEQKLWLESRPLIRFFRAMKNGLRLVSK